MKKLKEKYPNKGYGYYGYGYPYAGYGKGFQKALVLLKKLIKDTEEEDLKDDLQEILDLLSPEEYGYYQVKEAAELATDKAVSLVNKLLKNKELSDEDKETLQEIKDLLKAKPKGYPAPEKESAQTSNYIYESVSSIDFIEEDKAQPFRFSGIALKGGTESKNGRYYPKEVVEKAVNEAKDNLDELRIMVGHPEKNETSPVPIVGKFLSIEFDEKGNVPFEAEIGNTSLGKDAQEALRANLWQDLSIRAEGSMVKESVDGRKREKVTELHLRGLDFVIEGGIPESKVTKILSESGGEKIMTKAELLEVKEVQELLEETKTQIAEMTERENEEGEKKIKELETKLAEAKEARDKVETELNEKKLADFKESKVSELKVSDKVKELLRNRVNGKNEEEIKKSIDKEFEYIKEIAPIFKEGPKVHGIPAREEEKPKEKIDEEILREGHSANWDLIKKREKELLEV